MDPGNHDAASIKLAMNAVVSVLLRDEARARVPQVVSITAAAKIQYVHEKSRIKVTQITKRIATASATSQISFNWGKMVRTPPTNNRIGAPSIIKGHQLKRPPLEGMKIVWRPQYPVMSAMTAWKIPKARLIDPRFPSPATRFVAEEEVVEGAELSSGLKKAQTARL